MTFNIRNGIGDAGTDNSWDEPGLRRDRVVNCINSYDPDLIGMQEGFEWQLDYLLANCEGSYGSIGRGRLAVLPSAICLNIFKRAACIPGLLASMYAGSILKTMPYLYLNN